MNLIRRIGIIVVIALFFASCGGGGSSSGSGIGGTGITLVQGNVSSVNGQFFAYIKPEGSQNIAYLTEWIIPLSFAQSATPGSLIVSGGGQSTRVNSSGQFQLSGVIPSASFVLTFKVIGNDTILLGIGGVPKGATVTVKNIAIDTNSGSANSDEIDVIEPAEIEDDISEDNENESEDNISEDNPEDQEDSDDSIDDVSSDEDQ